MAMLRSLKVVPSGDASRDDLGYEGRAALLDFPSSADGDAAGLTSESAAAPVMPADATDEKAARKLERRLETRVLDPWERYRALLDLVDNYSDLSEAADRKTRFCLIIMGALNALNLLIIAKPDVLRLVSPPSRSLVALYVGTYAALSLYLVIQSVGALKPHIEALFGHVGDVHSGKRPLAGVRFIGSVVQHDSDAYYDQWQQVQVGQLNHELALHAQVLARANVLKYQSLNRIYRGLVAVTVLTAALITAVAVRGLM
jgi:hypothetical protein